MAIVILVYDHFPRTASSFLIKLLFTMLIQNNPYSIFRDSLRQSKNAVSQIMNGSIVNSGNRKAVLASNYATRIR